MKFLFSILAVLTAFFVSAPAFAVSTSATPIHVLAASTNVDGTGGSWLVLDSSTLKSVKGIVIANSLQSSDNTYQPVDIGIAAHSASADAEVAQMVVPAGSGTVAVYYPMVTSGLTRISARLDDGSTAVKGELIVNLIYN